MPAFHQTTIVLSWTHDSQGLQQKLEENSSHGFDFLFSTFFLTPRQLILSKWAVTREPTENEIICAVFPGGLDLTEN